MLPFSKRNVRPEEAGDVIHTGEFEVVRAGGLGASGKGRRQSERPRAVTVAAVRPRTTLPSFSDDDRTMVMAPKPSPSSAPPATRSTVPLPTVRPQAHGLTTPAPSRALPTLAAPRTVDPERTMLRPSAAPVTLGAPAPASLAAPRGSSLPPPVTRSPTPAPAARSSAAPASRAPDSDPRVELPAAVITARTRAVAPALGRPTFSWSAALMAMGVFVGLVSAVVARGDTDALIDATASFVDPSHPTSVRVATAAPAAVNPAPGVLPVNIAPGVAGAGLAAAPIAVAAPAGLPPGTQVVLAQAGPGGQPILAACPTAEPRDGASANGRDGAKEVKEARVAKADESVRSVEALPRAPEPAPRPAPPRPRYVPRPVERSVARSAPRAADARDVEARAERAPVRSAVAAPAPRPARASDGDMEGAAAADALARAQLEASLH